MKNVRLFQNATKLVGLSPFQKFIIQLFSLKHTEVLILPVEQTKVSWLANHTALVSHVNDQTIWQVT